MSRSLNYPLGWPEEWMDGSDFSQDEYRATLRQLATINRWTGGHALVIDEIKRLLGSFPLSKTITILDFGSGGGDTLIALRAWLQNQKRTLPSIRLVGVDINPDAIEFAKNAAQERNDGVNDAIDLQFYQGDIFDPQFLAGIKIDVVITSMTLHHFRNEELLAIVEELMRRASLGVIINDLHNHWIAREFIRWITRLFGATRMICHDAPVSVERGFQVVDWLRLRNEISASGNRISSAFEFEWKWAFRWCVRIGAGVTRRVE